MYNSIAKNKRNTIIIMTLFVVIIGVIGWLVSYLYDQPSLTVVVLISAMTYAVIQYYFATKISLAMTGAKYIEKRDNPRLYRIVENLAITTGLPTPKIYIINDPAPNAFATGRDPRHSIVAATTGLLDIMSDSELEAVMAHEMGHIQNYDIRLGMITFGLVSAIGFLSDVVLRLFVFGDNDNDKSPVTAVIGIFVVILAPVAAAIVQMAVSRQREYLADSTSALTTRNPEALAQALEKLKVNARPLKKQNTAAAHLFFANPLKSGFMNNMFSTHPPIDERISRLRENANKF